MTSGPGPPLGESPASAAESKAHTSTFGQIHTANVFPLGHENGFLCPIITSSALPDERIPLLGVWVGGGRAEPRTMPTPPMKPTVVFRNRRRLIRIALVLPTKLGQRTTLRLGVRNAAD